MPLKVTRKQSPRDIAKSMALSARAANLETAQRMTEQMRRDCPVSDNNEPGHVHTRDTIEARASEDGSATVEAGGAAVWINFGTYKTPAHPFFTAVVYGPEIQRHFSRLQKAVKLK
ncbi:MAG: hypothetical protein WBP93_04525 [Pyrinomonadaceae bacterium]